MSSASIVTDFNLTKISNNNYRVSWVADDYYDKNYVYRNSVLLDFIEEGNVNRHVDFTAQPEELSVIEVHRIPSDYSGDVDDIPTITEDVDDLLYLHWDRISDAVYYNIYYSEADNAERLLKRYQQDEITVRYKFALPRLKSISGVWHHFRVEAVDNFNNESTTYEWHHFVYGLPQYPETVTWTGGSGIFNLTIGF